MDGEEVQLKFRLWSLVIHEYVCCINQHIDMHTRHPSQQHSAMEALKNRDSRFEMISNLDSQAFYGNYRENSLNEVWHYYSSNLMIHTLIVIELNRCEDYLPDFSMIGYFVRWKQQTWTLYVTPRDWNQSFAPWTVVIVLAESCAFEIYAKDNLRLLWKITNPWMVLFHSNQ